MDRLINKLMIRNGSNLARINFRIDRPLEQMLRNDRKFQSIYCAARSFILQQSTIPNMCQQCRAATRRGCNGISCRKYSKVTSRQVSAITSLLSRSPDFLQAFHSPVQQQLQHFHSSCIQRDQEKNKDSQSSNQQPNEDDEEDAKRKTSAMKTALAINLLLLFIMGLLMVFSSEDSLSSAQKYISWNEFYHHILTKGEVKSITMYMRSEESFAVVEVQEGAVIKGSQVAPGVYYVVKIPPGFKFEEKVREWEDELGMTIKERIPINYTHPKLIRPMVLFWIAVLGMLFLAMSRSAPKAGGKDGGNMTDLIDMMSGGMRQAKFTRVDIASKGAKAVSFKDVAGLKEAKIEIMEFIDYLTHPERYQKLGAKTPRGALLLGPPGCGKTLLARALATEAKVPFLAMAGSEFVEMIGGVGAARVRNLFKEARARAPCIIYIDEVDAIGRARGNSSSSSHDEEDHTLNQLLVEMDGIGTQEGVIMVAATNRADILDKALLRPGRFDRHIMIDVPTLAEREEIFTVYLEKLKLKQAASHYAKPLSRLTPGMSGADINNICNEAAIHAARDSHKTIDTKDFEYAVERVIAGVEKKTNLLSPKDKKVVAYHESGHALVGWLLKHTDALLRISILPRTNSALGFTQYLPSDQHLYSQEELFERMCMALGGRAAESLVFNHVSTGAHDDLKRVTDMAYNQIQSYGMNERIGHLSFPSHQEQQGLKPYSQKLSQIMDEEARRLVAKAYLHTQNVLQENRDKLNKLATTLLEKEVLNYDEIEVLIGAPPHGKKNTLEPHGWEGIMPEAKDEEMPKSSSRRRRKNRD